MYIQNEKKNKQYLNLLITNYKEPGQFKLKKPIKNLIFWPPDVEEEVKNKNQNSTLIIYIK